MFEINDYEILSPAQKFTGFFDKKHHKAMASNTSIQNNAAPDAIKFSGFIFLLLTFINKQICGLLILPDLY